MVVAAVALPSAEDGGGGAAPLSKPVNMQIKQLKFMPRCSQTRKVHLVKMHLPGGYCFFCRASASDPRPSNPILT